jgi:hypothetical protein
LRMCWALLNWSCTALPLLSFTFARERTAD